MFGNIAPGKWKPSKTQSITLLVSTNVGFQHESHKRDRNLDLYLGDDQANKKPTLKRGFNGLKVIDRR